MRIREFINRLKSDKYYLEKKFRKTVGYELNLKSPATFNEKLQWLKLYDRKPEYTKMVDKYEVKQYVGEKIGNEYIIPTLGIWDKFEDIDFDKLPNQFVLKCTHDSGGLIICKDKSDLDLKDAGKKLNNSLKRNYFYNGREWPYKNVRPRIIAEQYIREIEFDSLLVYKVFVFNGIPKIIQVIQNDKQKNESIDYFDTQWNLLDLRQNFPNSVAHIKKPSVLKEMLFLSSKLSSSIPFVRVDWYIPDGALKFSEFTFYSDAGFARFHPEKWDNILGDWIVLPKGK